MSPRHAATAVAAYAAGKSLNQWANDVFEHALAHG